MYIMIYLPSLFPAFLGVIFFVYPYTNFSTSAYFVFFRCFFIYSIYSQVFLCTHLKFDINTADWKFWFASVLLNIYRISSTIVQMAFNT